MKMLRLLLNAFLRRFLNSRGKARFIAQLGASTTILDVGCGNDSPAFTKALRPDLYYVGLDVADYNQASASEADEYILVDPKNFSSGIHDGERFFGAIISSHNLEHCLDRVAVLQAMTDALAIGGQIYLAFPTEDSVKFPKRAGTLNYFDDSSHIAQPPIFREVLAHLQSQGLEVNFAAKRHRPPLLWLTGLFQEIESWQTKANKPGTWAFWGFESIVWATKLETVPPKTIVQKSVSG